MQVTLQEPYRVIWISGFASKPSDAGQLISRIQRQSPSISCQLLDLDRIPGSKYLLHATVNAIKSFESHQQISRSLNIQILLYAAANKQIGEALEQVGVTKYTHRLAVIVVGEKEPEVTEAVSSIVNSLGCKNHDELLDEWNPSRRTNVRSIFDITEKEIFAIIRDDEREVEAIERLAIERSALLAFKK